MTYDNLEIIGTGSYLPKEIVPNSSFVGNTFFTYGPKNEALREKTIVNEDEIFAVTGIRERRRAAPNETASSMGYEAAVRALESAKVKPRDLSGIMFASVTEPRDFPGGAAEIGARLGLDNFLARNITAACCGYVDGFIMTRERAAHRPGIYLLVAAEHLTNMLDPKDLNSTLFGDGAGAAVLAPTEEEHGIVADFSTCNPSNGRIDYIFRDEKRFLRMPEGSKVFREAVSSMGDAAQRVKVGAAWRSADVYIFHQANARIIDSIAKSISKDNAVVCRTIHKYGNMSAATCAVALDEALRDGTIKRSVPTREGSKVVITAFASGLSTAAVAIQF